MGDFFRMLLDPKVVDAFKNIGIPTIILGFLMAGIYRASTWSGEHVLKPLVTQQILFMEEVAAAAKKNSETLEQMGVAIDKLQEAAEIQTKTLERVSEPK